jgi:hypothetical protein
MTQISSQSNNTYRPRTQPARSSSQTQTQTQRSQDTRNIAQTKQMEAQRDRFVRGTNSPSETHRPNAVPSPNDNQNNIRATQSANAVQRGITENNSNTAMAQDVARNTKVQQNDKPTVSDQTKRDIDTLATSTSGRERSQARNRLRNDVYRDVPGVADAIADRIQKSPDSAGKGTVSLHGALAGPAKQGNETAQRALQRAEVGAHVTNLTQGDAAEREAAKQALSQSLRSSDPNVRQQTAQMIGDVAAGKDFNANQAKEFLGQVGTKEALEQVARTTGNEPLAFSSENILKNAGQAGLDALKSQWPNLSSEQRNNLTGVLKSQDAIDAVNRGDPITSEMMGDLAMQGTTAKGFDRILAKAGTPAAADELARIAGHSSEATAYLAGASLEKLGQVGAEAAGRAWDTATDAQKNNLLQPLSSEAGLKTQTGQRALLEAAASNNPELSQAGLKELSTAKNTGQLKKAMGEEAAKAYEAKALAIAGQKTATTTDAGIRETALQTTKDFAKAPAGRFGTFNEGSELDSYGALMKAADHPSATPEGKAALSEHAQKMLKNLSTSKDINEKLGIMKNGDLSAKAEVLANANYSDLQALQAGLKAEGRSLAGEANALRENGLNDAFDQTIDNLSRAGQSDAAAASLRQASQSGDTDALTRFADRNLVQTDAHGQLNEYIGSETLAKVNTTDATKALMQTGLSSPIAQRMLKTHTDQRHIDQATQSILGNSASSAQSKEAAATLATNMGNTKSVQQAAQFRKAEAQSRINAAQNVMDRTDGRIQEAQTALGKREAVRAGLVKEGIKVPETLNRSIALMKKNLETLIPQREAAAQKVADYLSQPEVRKSLGNLSASEAGTLLDQAGKAVGSTKAGTEFGRDVIARELGQKQIQDPFFKRALDGAGKIATATDRSVSAVNRFVAGLSMAGSNKYQAALAHASGLSTEQISNFAKMDSNARVRNELGRALGKAGNAISKVSAGLDVMNAGLSLVKAAQNPRDKRAWADAANNVATAAKNFTKLGSRANIGLTAITGPLTMITGNMDLHDSIGKNDYHSIGGNGAVTAGGAMATAGVIMSATGVGAAAGVPLMVAGGIVSAGGTVYSHFFGDGWAEAEAKKMGYIIGDGERR